MSDSLKPVFYQKLFRDICRGYSTSTHEDKYFYIKHLHFSDYIELNEEEEVLKEKALKKGLLSEKQTLLNLDKDKIWTAEDDSFIENHTIYIDNLKKTKSQLLLSKEKESYQKIIDSECEILNKKKETKFNLLKNTAESFAKSRFSDHYIYYVLYNDISFSKKPWTKDEFDHLSHKEIFDLINIHNEYQKNFSEENIQNLILQEFFLPYMYIAENSSELFGVSAHLMTQLQLSVIMHSKIFKNIFDNNSDIPEEIKKDPEQLLEFSSNSKTKEKNKENLNKEGASTVFGATQEDYAQLGVEKDQLNKNTLSQEAAKKGGSLNMNDLMKLQGV